MQQIYFTSASKCISTHLEVSAPHSSIFIVFYMNDVQQIQGMSKPLKMSAFHFLLCIPGGAGQSKVLISVPQNLNRSELMSLGFLRSSMCTECQTPFR